MTTEPVAGGEGSGVAATDQPVMADGASATGTAGGPGRPRQELVLVDGDLVAPNEAAVSAFDRAVLFGESLFETVKIRAGRPCFWRAHRERLHAGCQELGLPLDPEALEAGVRRLLGARFIEWGALRIQVTGGVQPGGGRAITAPTAGRRPRVIAAVYETAPLPDEIYEQGVDVVVANDLCRPLPHLKSGSYLASVVAKRRAEAAGAFECLLAPGGRLLEGSFTNLLLVEGNRLISPPPDACLPGVTVGVVKQTAQELGLTVEERDVTVAAAQAADGLLLTGSLLGVCHCARMEGIPLRPARELATVLRAALDGLEAVSRGEW